MIHWVIRYIARNRDFMNKKDNITPRQKELRKRIIELSYQLKFSHIGSCLSVVDIIDAVYQVKHKEERFVLSCGHAAVALYAVLEKNKIIDPSIIKELHIHPDRNIGLGIDVSSGSLGQGLPIAAGMALADRKKRVFCVMTDGECAEGSVWEAFRFITENNINNIVVIINANGWGAYNPISLPTLFKQIKGFCPNAVKTDGHNLNKLLSVLETTGKSGPSVIFAKTTVEQLPFLKGQDAHYYIMNSEDFELAKGLLQ